MPSFKDNAGRVWVVEITVSTVKRCRALIGVDLLEILGGKLVEKILGDPIILVDLIYVIVKPEADKLGITDEEFGRAMAGDAIDGATKALLEGLVSFFPSPRDRANLAAILTKVDVALDASRDRMTETIKSGALDKAIETALNISSGDALASSA